jgi:copper resistance protein B
MKRLLIAMLAASAAAPALAQHSGHTMPTPAAQPVKPTEADPHAGHGMEAQPPAPAPDPHATHRTQPASPTPVADPHAGHTMPQQPAVTADPHAGHDVAVAPKAPPTDPHAGHDMSAMGEAVPAPPVAPPPPEALSGPAHAADLVYGPEAMADARAIFRDEHGNVITHMVLVDLLETRIRDGKDGYAWSGQAWYGGDINRLWIKTEGEGSFGESPESAEVQALYSRAIDPWFNLQAGVRYDFRPDPERAYLVLGVQGLARYWFEVDGALFVSEKGDLSARFEAEYDQRITQKLILQPRIEFDLAAQDVPELGIGSGLTKAGAGLRLRYEFVPEFAPYVGVEYERAFGDTADFARAAGEKAGGWAFLIGLRSWF